MELKRGIKIIAAVFVSLLALSLAACGDDGTSADKAVEQAVEQAKSNSGDKIDACTIVTQDEAAKLFGHEAVRDDSGPVLDANLLGECLWGYDTETAGELLQFYIWNGEVYYSKPADAEDFDLGDKGHILINQYTGIDISWVQDGRTIDLAYSGIGPDAPDQQTKVDELKALARKVSDEL